MKSLFSLFMFFFASTVFAQVDVPPPPYLKDAEIQVHLKSGTVNNFSANDYKVVTRASSKKTQALIDSLRAELAACKAELEAAKKSGPAPTPVVVEEKKVVVSPNRVAFFAGIGPDGLGVKETANGQDIRPRLAPLIGVSYARKLADDSPWSIGGQGISGISPKSRTYTLMLDVGYDF